MISIEQIRPYESYLVDNRREIHKYPETGFEEVKTSQLVMSQLTDLGIEISSGIGKTGIIGKLKGDSAGPVIAIRADMDALNLTEIEDVEFKSTHVGKMHACGHDAHTAMVLGTAKFLSEHRELLKGTVKFIFQPAEEGPYPGGAILMMESGLLDDVTAVFGLHVDPSADTGTILIPEHAAMAGADFFSLQLMGRGGHGAAPQDSVDTIYMSSQVINAFQAIISRRIDPVSPAVISVCTINGGSSYNILPETVSMTGTLRAMEASTREILLKEIDDTLKGICAMCHGDYKFELIEGYPPLFNHPPMSEFASRICGQLLGVDNVSVPATPRMASEDFAYYLKKIPGAFMWLGCQDPEKKHPYGLHSPRFVLDENVLVRGTTILANLVIEFLDQPK